MGKVTIPEVLNTPIDETKFISNARDIFQELDVYFSTELPKLLGKLCRTLNHSIANPKSSPLDLRNIWAFPAQTGVGKSVALQIYTAMLCKNDKSSLICVFTNQEAEEYAQYICHQVGDKNCAKAFFSDGNNKKYKYSSSVISEVKKHSCIIITHKKMQELANDNISIDSYRLYRDRPRDLFVIDEKLKFSSHETVSLKEFKSIVDFAENALVYSRACRKLAKRSHLTKQLNVIYEFLNSKAEVLNEEKPAMLIHPEDSSDKIDENKLPEVFNLKLLQKIVETRFDELSDEINSIRDTKIPRLTSEKNKTLTLVKKFSRIMQREEGDGEYCDLKELLLYKDNKGGSISKCRQFYSSLGTCIVLDATAEVNKYYASASRGWLPWIEVIEVPKIRKYNKLNFFIAKGFLQSIYSLCHDDKKVQKTIDIYLPVIKSLKGDGHKLLVIGHQKLISELKDIYEDDEQVAFTYWGLHKGKNDWNDCDRVLVIGWNYLPPIETVSEVFSGHMASGSLKAISKVTKSTLEEFSVSQIAQDIIQGVMRSRARKIASDDSDCLPTDVYLLYPDREKEQAIIDTVTNEFPGRSINTWVPPIGIDQSNFTQPEKNAHKILEALDHFKKTGDQEVSSKKIIDYVDLSPSTISKAKSTEYFKEGMETRGFKIEAVNKREDKIVL